MKFTTITNIENLRIELSTILGLQSKSQKSNVQLMLLTSDEIYIKENSIVKLYRASLETNKMYFDSEGMLVDCLKDLDSWANVFMFPNFATFYEWYKAEKEN